MPQESNAPDLNVVLQRARELAKENDSPEISSMHLLKAITETDAGAREALTHHTSDWTQFEETLSTSLRSELPKDAMPLTDEAEKVLISLKEANRPIGSRTILAAMTTSEDSPARSLLHQYVNVEALSKELGE
jgi:ATP-dependent Clp protease ATP-binding subunit ClpA